MAPVTLAALVARVHGWAGSAPETGPPEEGRIRILALRGVVQQSGHPAQLQPVGRLAEQPGTDALPPPSLSHVQVADIGPATQPGRPAARVQVRVHLDIADDIGAPDRAEAGAVDAHRPS